MAVKVLYDITTLGSIHAAQVSPGGIFQHVERLGLALAHNPDVEFYVGAREGQEQKVIRYIEETGNFSANTAALEERGFAEQAKRIGAQTVHVNWRGAERLPAIDGTRVIFTLPDIIAVKAPHYFAKKGDENPAREYILNVLCSVTPNHELVVSAHKVKRDILQRFGRIDPKQINVAPLGHNLDQQATSLADSEVKDKISQSKDFNVLCLNTIEPRKNMRTVLRALDWLHRNHPRKKIKIFMIGAKGWLNDQFNEEIANLPDRAKEKLVFLGFVSDAEVRFALENCDAFVFPSFDEGFGLPILEAMAAGLPVITSHAVACRETAGYHSHAINGNSGKELGQKILEIAKAATETRNLAQPGQAYAKPRTWDWSAQVLADIYSR